MQMAQVEGCESGGAASEEEEEEEEVVAALVEGDAFFEEAGDALLATGEAAERLGLGLSAEFLLFELFREAVEVVALAARVEAAALGFAMRTSWW
jgi:hypothetical protein